jgi:hypothetical protein
MPGISAAGFESGRVGLIGCEKTANEIRAKMKEKVSFCMRFGGLGCKYDKNKTTEITEFR